MIPLAKVGDKDAKRQQALFERILSHLDSGQPVRNLELSEQENDDIRSLHLLTQKPTLYIANVEEEGIATNPWLGKLEDLAHNEDAEVIPICAAIESEIAELPDDEKKEFLTELGLEEPGLNRIIRAGYSLLGLQTFFTAGPQEVRAWTIRAGDSALRAAGTIHTDFARGFIRAEITAFNDFIAYKGEQGAKDAGKWRLEGKDYVVQDADVILFRFNV